MSPGAATAKTKPSEADLVVQVDEELIDWDFRLDILPPATYSSVIPVDLILVKPENPTIQPD